MQCKLVSTTSLQHELKIVWKCMCNVPIVLCEVLWLCDYLLIWWSAVISVYDCIDYVKICYLISIEICRYSMIFGIDKCRQTWDRYIDICVSYYYLCIQDMHTWKQYAYLKHKFWKVFPKRVLLRDFAFKHKLGTLMPKSSFEIGEILKEVKSILFDF